MLIGTTVLSKSPTQAVFPSGEMAIHLGDDPALIGRPGLFVAILIGITTPPPILAT
jgi:hypothetical protein